jgi:two-component system KDP operon response regulator KdpE
MPSTARDIRRSHHYADRRFRGKTKGGQLCRRGRRLCDQAVQQRRAGRARRSRPSTRPRQAFDDERLNIDFDSRQVRLDGNVIPLSAKEWRLLECLVKYQGRVASREMLLRYAWGEGYEHEYNYLKVFISHLRRKIGDSPDYPHYIHTERDVGYRFDVF